MSGPVSEQNSGLDPLSAVREAAGSFVRPTQRLVRGLVSDWSSLPELVALSGAPRREVEQVLATLSGQLERDGDRYRLSRAHHDEAGKTFELATLSAYSLDDVAAGRLARRPELSALITGWQDSRPRPDRDLDHVPATPETVARRALWLDSQYDLTRTEVLCIGDHDLTSLGIAACTPGARVTVVDVDDRVLRVIDDVAREHGWNVRCVWGDFRLGLPISAQAIAGLVVTDPPYTPEGVSTFLVAGLRGLADQERGRLVMAYGHGDHQPALGLKVQEAVLGLHVAFEAILPGFNRYQGAQAIGSRSDLYVCRPTARTWRALPALVKREGMQIYTHGERSLESGGGTESSAEALEAALQAEQDCAGTPQGAGAGSASRRLLLVGADWPASADHDGAQRTSAGQVLAKGLPSQLGNGRDVRAMIDLSQAPATWLLRVLLALNVGWLGAVVPHGSCTDAEAELISDKYTVRRHRLRDSRFDLVTATATAQDAPGTSAVARDVLGKAHGQLRNTWREALIAASRRRGVTLTKNEARAVVEGSGVAADLLTTTRLVEAPRHLLEATVTRLREFERSLDLSGSD